MGDIRELVRDFVVDNIVLDSDETFTDETDLKETGILDSFATLKVITFIEDEFDVKLRAEDLENRQLDGPLSVANIEKLVESRNAAVRSKD